MVLIVKRSLTVVAAVHWFGVRLQKRMALSVLDDLNQAMIDRPGRSADITLEQILIKAVSVNLDLSVHLVFFADRTFHGSSPRRQVDVIEFSLNFSQRGQKINQGDQGSIAVCLQLLTVAFWSPVFVV